MSIVLQSSGGGQITLQEPTTASNFTQTLPAATGTVALLDGSNNFSVAGDLSFNSGYGSSAVAYGCRAWVNFNGSTSTIRASGNVSSITDNAEGRFTLNLINALPDVNFSLAGNASLRDAIDDGNSGVVAIRRLSSFVVTTSAIPIQTTYYGPNGTLGDFPLTSVMVIR